MLSTEDIHFMEIALQEAMKGSGQTSPNPRVGAVITREGREIARGYHKAYGEPHAEVDALSKITAEEASGSTLYVNLEPCCHYGKTPPCTWAIIQAGVKRVVYGMADPNAQVNGRGIEELREAGLEVNGPVLEDEAMELNRGYLKFRQSSKPWVLLKFAQTIDGRIAASTGDARWISDDASLELAHQLRAECDAIMVGINTALQDDPELTVRRVEGNNPYRIVLDPTLKISPEAKVFDANPKPVYIATQPYPPQKKAEQLTAKGAEFIWLPPGVMGTLDLDALLTELGQKGFHYLLVEGGANVLSSLIQRQLCDELVVVTAPKIIGGDGIPCVAPMGITKVADAIQFEVIKREEYGPDLAVWYRLKKD